MTSVTGNGVVVVTGGLSGIGAAAAAACRDKGWRVVVIDRAARTDTGAPPGIALFPDSIDVTDEAAIARVADAIETNHGPVAGLVNAAGVLGKMHPPQKLAMADWDRDIKVDLRGTFVPCREFGARMAGRRAGAIVNIASVVGVSPAPVHGYAPAKAAVISLTMTLAAEWGPSGVRVNAVSPGFTDTPALQKGMQAGALDPARMAAAAALGRLVRPQEVAAAITWLLSDQASAITGVNLPVDAGFLAAVGWQVYGGLRGPDA
ncbi:MAG TPA: SDR family oxidoreductase [Candidatus Sulfotelmatobacter sp.]|nr:SDR family oxidoreductase [Candidatus Sulfotelmatobacter sp.]